MGVNAGSRRFQIPKRQKPKNIQEQISRISAFSSGLVLALGTLALGFSHDGYAIVSRLHRIQPAPSRIS
jgi:hypothetical protein